MRKVFMMTGRSAALATLLLFLWMDACPQDKKDNWGITFGGFVKSDFWVDSRQVFSSREDLFLFYPKDVVKDRDGNDVNDAPCFNYSAMTSRLTGAISGPKAFGAATSGLIEGDFSGVSNDHINGFRLRHAYFQMNWKHAALMGGQYWHPLFVPEVIPSVISLNTGAPFQPFIRNPLLTVAAVIDKHKIAFSVIAQRDNANDGPEGITSKYLRFSPCPNLHLQYLFKSDRVIAGAGADYKQIRPRLQNDSLKITSATVKSMAVVAFFKYTAPSAFCIRFKSIFGQNLTEHLMLGGYAVSSFDTVSGNASYTPTNHLSGWLHLSAGKKIQPALFLGYVQNLGTSGNNTGKFFARGADIASMWRIAPSLSVIVMKTQFSLEAEYTRARFGTPDISGIPRNTHPVSNLRGLFTFYYFF